jgi:GAF domain-containing protein
MTDESAQRELEELRRALGELMEVTAALNSTLDVDALLASIVDATARVLGAERASLLLLDEETGELVFRISADAAEQRVPAGQGVAGWVVQNGEPLKVDDTRSDDRFYAGVDEASGVETRNIVAVPLRTKERNVGVLEAMNKDAGFTDDDVRIAQALGDHAAIALENARLYARLADAVVTSRLSYRL